MAVQEYGRGLYWVTSNSRYGLFHLVDIEPELNNDGTVDPRGEPYRCSCESWGLRGDRPCRHCVEVLEYLRPVLEHLAHWDGPIPPPVHPVRKVRKYVLKP